MAAQRKILSIVNTLHKGSFELCGLSNQAIERWERENAADAEVVERLKLLSDKLFFLGQKSQQSISDVYRASSAAVDAETKALKAFLESKLQ